MARARNVKPALFKNELLGQGDPNMMILFVGLWTLADRRGILEDRPLRIKAELFPYRDGIDVNGYLTELERLGFLERFAAKGMALIHILNFSKHQSPHPTEKPNDLPGIEEKDESNQAQPISNVTKPLSNGSGHVTAALIPSSLIPSSLNADSLLAAKKRRTQLPDDFYPNENGIEKANEARISITTELEAFRNHHKSHGKTMIDWQAAWLTWVGNAVKFAARSPPRQTARESTIDGLTGGRATGRQNEKVINGEAKRIG